MDTIAKALNMSPSTVFDLLEDRMKECLNFNGSVPGAFPGWKSEEFSEEHRKNMSIAASKRVRTKEHIQKLHEGRRNSKNSKEHKAVLVASRVGSKHSEKTKKKMSEAKKNSPSTKRVAIMGGKASAAARPENYKEIQSERMKLWWAERKKKIGG
jgi:hypothetical protein